MDSQQLESLKVLGSFRKAVPFERAADTRLECEFHRIPTMIESSVKALGTQKYLGISQARSGDGSQVLR